MKTYLKSSIAMFVVVSGLLFLNPHVTNAFPDISFPNGMSFVVESGDTTQFNTQCSDFIEFASGTDLNIFVLATASTTLELLNLPATDATFTTTPAGADITGHFQWNPTPNTVLIEGLRFRATNDQGDTTYCDIFYDFPLPVELSSFTSLIKGNDVMLNWTTSTESNNARFEIERSSRTVPEWNKVGTVSGNGNSKQAINYSFSDHGVGIGNYSYRLKQIDFNGNFKYHNLNGEVVIGIPSKFELSQNYPNPFNPSTKIDFQLPADGNVNLYVYDISGRLVSTISKGFRTAGYYTEVFNASNISSGAYYYKIEYRGSGLSFDKVLKLVVLK